VSGHHPGDISTGFKCRAKSKAFQRFVNLAELVLRSVALAAPNGYFVEPIDSVDAPHRSLGLSQAFLWN